MAGTFTLESTESPIAVTGILGAPVTPTGGYGGWERIARPRRKALTEWQGNEGLSFDLTFVFDAIRDDYGAGVEPTCASLDLLGGIGEGEPALCRIHSDPAGLIPYGFGRNPDKLWFVESINWDGDETVYNNVGNRVQVTGSIVLTEYIKDERLEEQSSVARRKAKKKPTKKGKGKKGAKNKTYIVKRGDSLTSIAARKLGSASRWREIGKLNGIRDPKNIKVGQRLKLP